MKYFITALFLFASFIGISQSTLLVDGKLNIDSLYQNKEELLLHSGVLEFEGLTKEQLKTKVKNWGATNFVNLKEVLISETDDQIVLNYIDKSMFMRVLGSNSPYHWYIRLVIQFKDGKIRCLFYDDGNTFQPSSQYAQSINSRTYKLSIYFKETDGIKYAQKSMTNGMVALKESTIRSQQSLKESIEKKDSDKKEW
jgi:hypothetical protein